ncbi:MAG TPA: N-acetylneuraminate synthase family protein, partial [bacterium]|nr:N-acetylneuraminate synthase family protein [bacterium]
MATLIAPPVAAVPEVSIAGIPVGPRHPPFLLAEIGINHNGDPDLAIAMLHAAKAAGAGAAKFQAFTPDRLFNRAINPKAVELFAEWALSRDDFRRIKEEADRIDLPFLCTPFDRDWV